MKVLICCLDDYANLQHGFAKSLRSVGIDCEDCKLILHPFNYETQSSVIDLQKMIEKVKESDLTIFVHSNIQTFEQIKFHAKRMVVVHTGSPYRDNSKYQNQVFNPYCEMVLTDQTEFMSLGGKNIKYIAAAIDTDKIKPIQRRIEQPYTYGHFPSKAETKGTNDITRLFFDCLPYNFFKCKVDKVSHEENIKRMAGCDIYIELFKPLLNGNPYGCYGVSAFEAAALGKAVITQNIYPNVYKNSYHREHPFLIANHEKEFCEILLKVNDWPVEYLQEQQYLTRKWVEEKHSYEATGHYLSELLHL